MVELDEARERLGAIEQPLIDAHVAAVGKWKTLLSDRPDLALPLDTTTRANFIHNHLQSRGRARRRQRRRNRADRALARQMYTPEMVLALNGDSALTVPTLLTCGYTLDGDKVGRIEIRRDCKRYLPWAYDIYGGDAVMQPLTLDGMADDAKPAKVISAKLERQEGTDQAHQA